MKLSSRAAFWHKNNVHRGGSEVRLGITRLILAQIVIVVLKHWYYFHVGCLILLFWFNNHFHIWDVILQRLW